MGRSSSGPVAIIVGEVGARAVAKRTRTKSRHQLQYDSSSQSSQQINCGAAAAAYAGLASILFHNHDRNSFRIALTYFSQDGLLAGRKVDEDRNFLQSGSSGLFSAATA